MTAVRNYHLTANKDGVGKRDGDVVNRQEACSLVGLPQSKQTRLERPVEEILDG